MPQSESLLLLGLGFSAALVVAMLAGYAIWSTATAWADRKRKLAVPSIILDLQAEREALRAENAMTSSRLELLLEEARAQAAEKAAEVTRHRNRAVLFAKTLQAKDSEILSLRALATELTDETNRRAKIIARLTGREAKKLREVSFPAMTPIKGAVVLNGSAATPAEAKVRSTIAELNALSAQIAKQQEELAPARPAHAREEPEPEPEEPAAEPVVTEADTMTRSLSEALAELRAEIKPQPSAPDTPVESEPEAPQRPMTLAEKFRLLKSGMTPPQ